MFKILRNHYKNTWKKYFYIGVVRWCIVIRDIFYIFMLNKSKINVFWIGWCKGWWMNPVWL